MTRLPDDLFLSDAPQPQDLVITLLGSYVRPHDLLVWSGGLVEILGEFGFSSGAARVALTRLVRRDLLARVKSGRIVYYAIPPRADRLLAEGDRRIFSLGQDAQRADHWTVLWHAIPDDRRLERGRLARRLRFLGFGSVQDGSWVAPHNREKDVNELISELDVVSYTGVIVGRPAKGIDLRPLVERAWDFQALEDRYRAFVEAFRPFTAKRKRASLNDGDAFRVRASLVHSFRGFASLDPELPDEFMPDPDRRTEAVQIFGTLNSVLEEPARRHFDSVTRAKPASPAGLADTSQTS